MSKTVALLRGINVGGHRRVPMAELRTLVASLGHRDVATHLQSGNVVFTARGAVTPRDLEEAIASAFGIAVDVVLRDGADLEAVVAHRPFGELDPTTVHVAFLAAVPAPGALEALDADRLRPERCVPAGRELYLHLPNGMARARLPGALERRLGVAVTMRNWRTVTALAGLASP